MNSKTTVNEISWTGQVFFYLCDTAYSHLSICLAEGLKKLDIPFYSNINYWKITPERDNYLFRHHPSITHNDCDVVVLDKNWTFSHQTFPEHLFSPDRTYVTVYLDDLDGPKASWTEDFDFIFRTHCNWGIQYPKKFVPWAFGLSNRILQATSNLPKFQERNRHLLVNFRLNQETLRVSNWCKIRVEQGWLRVDQGVIHADYPLRRIVRDLFFPQIQTVLPVEEIVDSFNHHPVDDYQYLQWIQTGKRHYPTYYKHLKESVACASFAGWRVPDFGSGETRVEWWDSWRFWESLAAGCVTFQVDFEKYGIKLPVMPENWRHYIGIDLDNIQSTVERIASDPDILERISQEGRMWAIDNYSPVPTALRFLNIICSCQSPVDNQVTLHSVTSAINSLPIPLRDINFIVFPDWCEPEEFLCLELERVVRTLLHHPDCSRMTLLIDISDIAEEDANLLLSSVTMNLLFQEDREVANTPEIALISTLDPVHSEALLSCIQARIVLKNENKQAMTQRGVQTIPAYELNRLPDKRAVQLETGCWDFQ
ncbi:hypothetical protein [Coleofasciculus sp. G2-EDA-02]|uniref:hypothetical protein n=1 Tax=Coleofasciculus sp. G2-EDA-02 TaxID=3069529 RepID=UPI0032F10314